MNSSNILVDEDMEFEECYTLGEFLFKGHFGDIWTCTELETSTKNAVKIKTLNEETHTLREGVIWRRLKHRNIIELIRIFKTPLKQYLVTEYVDGGNLFDQVVNFTTYTERDACYFMKQLFEVLSYLREKQVIHRDIKTDNLIIKKSSYGEILKLTDFGLAVRLGKGEKEIKIEPNGAPLHLAPETILEKPVSYGVDVWGAGIIFFTLIGGYPPFWNERPEKLYADIVTKGIQMTPTFWDNVSDKAKDLIHSLLDKNPDDRITAKNALQHPWILEHEEIPRMHRKKTVEKLKEFNARRKLKGAIFTVQTLYRMKSPSKRSSSHGGTTGSLEVASTKEPDRRASTSILDSNNNCSEKRQRSSIIGKTGHTDLPNQRKLSEVKVKFQPVHLVISLNEESE